MPLELAKDNKANLCDTCMLHPAECGANIEQILFGDSIGHDNIIGCELYHDSFIAIRENPEKK